MQPSRLSSRRILNRALAAFSLCFLAARVTAGEPKYTLKPIVKIGDTISDAHITVSVALPIGDQNDRGQITFGTVNQSGGWSTALFQYSDGQFTPIVAAGQSWPGGVWPQDIEDTGSQMNEQGDVVFTAQSSRAGFDGSGTYLWDHAQKRVTAVARPEAHALDGLDFQGAGGPGAAINSAGVVIFNAWLRELDGAGIFLQSPGEPLSDVLLPGQLSLGGRAVNPFPAANSLDDAGRAGFAGLRDGDDGISGFVWEHRAITPVALSGDPAPGGGTIATVGQVLLNNQNRTVLVEAALSNNDGSHAYNLYRWVNGRLAPVAVRDQPVPGTAAYRSTLLASRANERGQHALLVELEDDQVALFLLDPDGVFHRVLKSGMQTNLGAISEIVSNGLGLNSQGQVAVGVRLAGTTPNDETLVLCTPTMVSG